MPKPDRTIYTQRPATTRDDWTPARIRSARRAAEMGTLTQAAQLVEYMQTDDRIQGILSTRVRGLLKTPIRFEDATQDGQTPITEALEQDFWNAYPETDVAQLAYWGLLLGVGIGENAWELDRDSGRLIPRLRVWHPQWLHWSITDRQWVLDTEQGRIVVNPDEDSKWILYTPFGSKDPWRHGLYRSLAHWWLLKRYAILDWGGYSEAHGNPLRVGKSEVGTSKSYREELAADLQNMAGATGIALPEGATIDLVEATARTWETFQAQNEAANTAFSIALTGQNLTTEVSSGSLAAARVHETIRHDLIESDEQTLSTTLRAHMTRWYALYNFGPDQVAPWIRWDTAPPQERAKIEQHHINAGAVSINDIRRSLGLEPLDGDEYEQPLPPAKDEPAGLGFSRNNTPAPPPPGRQVRLASGDDPEASPGAVAGQAYIDRLATRGEPLDPIRQRVQELSSLIEDASSYEELLDRLPSVVHDIDDAGPMLEALIMAAAAGAAAEVEDHDT